MSVAALTTHRVRYVDAVHAQAAVNCRRAAWTLDFLLSRHFPFSTVLTCCFSAFTIRVERSCDFVNSFGLPERSFSAFFAALHPLHWHFPGPGQLRPAEQYGHRAFGPEAADGEDVPERRFPGFLPQRSSEALRVLVVLDRALGVRCWGANRATMVTTALIAAITMSVVASIAK